MTLADRWRGWRNALIGSPGFQRWAARFPLTRPVARRRAQALFDLTAGFVYSQIAHACVRSGLLERLAAGPAEVGDLAAHLDLDRDGALRLLRAAAALKLAESAGPDRWALGVEGAALLGAPGVAAMIDHHALLYADLADPLALLRRGGGGGALAAYWTYAEGGPPDAKAAGAYSGLMTASQAMVAAQVLDAYPMGGHRRLLDVGGGEGTFLRAVAARAPDVERMLFDLPAVAERARARFAAEGLQLHATGGDVFRDALPGGADIVSLIRVLHDHDDGPALEILHAIRRALEPGAVLIIGEPMAQEHGAERVGDAYFGIYLLAMGSGRPRPAREIIAMCEQAGFVSARRIPTAMPMIASLIVARA
ncbi:methyltransferase [Brevundimonas aurifodinae]|uniref:Methyltransferase n=2 Tax=Brevundimonas TaxID=41275 RepID=A0ABV1NPG2_9CAUL|nr:MAG: methyltransferase [Brevundimonas sp. 12-68-7]OYX35939.1 MAG: methyltransferase [Brevundimonas subvibrioides]